MGRKKKEEETILYSFRFPKGTEVESAEHGTKSMLCESFLVNAPETCPLCTQGWPTTAAPLERMGIKLSRPVYDKVQKFSSTYTRVWLLVELGLCPLCHQKMNK